MSDSLDQALAVLAAAGVKLDHRAARRALKGREQSPNVADLMLAWACLARNEPAIAYFERVYFSQATRALRRLRLPTGLTDDVLSWMRFELFARENGPLLGTYSGRGDLGSWVRSIAVHEALKRARKQRKEVSPEALAELPMPDADLLAMRGAYGEPFTRALSESFATLSMENRTLLRQYFLDGLTIDVLAKLYQVHRATAARRVSAARTELVDSVRERLKRELALSEAGVDQVITLSNLNESLGHLLRQR